MYLLSYSLRRVFLAAEFQKIARFVPPTKRFGVWGCGQCNFGRFFVLTVFFFCSKGYHRRRNLQNSKIWLYLVVVDEGIRIRQPERRRKATSSRFLPTMVDCPSFVGSFSSASRMILLLLLLASLLQAVLVSGFSIVPSTAYRDPVVVSKRGGLAGRSRTSTSPPSCCFLSAKKVRNDNRDEDDDNDESPPPHRPWIFPPTKYLPATPGRNCSN